MRVNSCRNQVFLELPLFAKSRNFWKMRIAINLSWESFILMKKVENWCQDGPAHTNLTPFISHIYFPFHSLSPLKVSVPFPVLSLLYKFIVCVKRCYISPCSNHIFELLFTEVCPAYINKLFLLIMCLLSNFIRPPLENQEGKGIGIFSSPIPISSGLC